MSGPWEKYAAQGAAVSDSGKPWEKYATAKPGPKEEEGLGATILGAALEPMAAMATGALGQVAGGVAGLGKLALGGSGKEAAETVGRVSESLSYHPKTEGGKTATEAISYPFRKLGEFSDEAGGRTTAMLERAGVPREAAAGVGAAGKTAMDFLPQLVGGRGAAAAAERAPTGIPSILPKPSAAVEAATERGVKLSPGQVLGGGWDRFEQAISKWPIVGAPIRGARSRAFESVNEATYNDVLGPVKQKMPDNVKAGHDSVAYLETKLGARYEDLLDKTKGSLDGPAGARAPGPTPPALAGPGRVTPPPVATVAPTRTLRQELTDLVKMVNGSKLPKAMKREFENTINDGVIGQFEESGIASGRTIREIDQRLRVLAKKKGLVDNYDVNKVGMALQEARSAVRRMVDRENPEYADELKATDAAWSKFKVVQKATTFAGKEGLFTPSQFERAVKAQDRSKDKAQYARGKANMQDLAKNAREAIGDAIPDSGTPSQFLAAALAESIGGKKMGMLGALGGLPIAAGLTLPYSEIGSGMIQRGLTGPPLSGLPAARGLPYGAAAAGRVTPPPTDQ